MRLQDRRTVLARVMARTGATTGADLAAFDAETGVVYTFNAVGADIWHQLGDPIRVDHLIEKAVADYAGDQDVIEAEVLRFVGELIERGLIAPVSGPPSS